MSSNTNIVNIVDSGSNSNINPNNMVSFEQLKLLASSDSQSNGLHVVEDNRLILKIPPFLINNYNECVRQFYRKMLHTYSVKYDGMVMAVDPNFKVYETFGHSFQDNHCMYMRACVRMVVFRPCIGSVYTVKVSRILPRDIIATLHGFIVVTISADSCNMDLKNISIGDELNVSVMGMILELESIKLEATIVENLSHSSVKTENMENRRCANEYNLLSNVETPSHLSEGRKRKHAD